MVVLLMADWAGQQPGGPMRCVQLDPEADVYMPRHVPQESATLASTDVGLYWAPDSSHIAVRCHLWRGEGHRALSCLCVLDSRGALSRSFERHFEYFPESAGWQWSADSQQLAGFHRVQDSSSKALSVASLTAGTWEDVLPLRGARYDDFLWLQFPDQGCCLLRLPNKGENQLQLLDSRQQPAQVMQQYDLPGHLTAASSGLCHLAVLCPPALLLYALQTGPDLVLVAQLQTSHPLTLDARLCWSPDNSHLVSGYRLLLPAALLILWLVLNTALHAGGGC